MTTPSKSIGLRSLERSPKYWSRGGRGEIELGVGAGGNVDGLKDTSSFGTVDDLEVGHIVPGNGATGVDLLHDIGSDVSPSKKFGRFVGPPACSTFKPSSSTFGI